MREALLLRPIKHSRIGSKAQFREHRLRTNKVVHVCRKFAVSQTFMEESTPLRGPLYGFYNILEEDFSFRVLFQVTDKT